MSAESGTADAVQHRIDRIFVKNSAEVVRSAVDDDIRPERTDHPGFFLRTDRGHHLGAERLRKLDRRDAETARARLDQDGLPGLEPGFDHKIQVRGGERLRQRGGLRHRQPFGNRQDQLLRHGGLFRVSASAEKRANPVSGFPPAAAGSGQDGSRNLKPHPLRPSRRRRIFSGPLEQVGAVQSGGVDFEQDFIGLRSRVWNYRPAHGPVFIDFHCIHLFHASSGCFRCVSGIAIARPPASCDAYAPWIISSTI